jgi:hypothetical protein
MTLLIVSVLLMMASTVTALILGYRLKANQPELHRSLGIIPWLRAPQFWVYQFTISSKRKNLENIDKSLALASILLLSASLLGFLVCVLEFARNGSL